MTTKGADDRRVRKTRRVLHEALVTLILERGWDAVSVRDVCEKADVGRSTFYVHFADKENLLLSGFDELHEAMEHVRSSAKVPFGFLSALVAHVAENARLVQALFGRQSGQSVQWRFRDVLASLVDAELKLLKVPKAARPLTTRFIAGGAAEVLMDWLDHPQATSADQLAGELAKLALAALEAAKSTRADGQRLHCNATAARSRLMHRAPGSVVCPDVPSMVGAVHPAHVHGSARAVGSAFSLRGELVGAE